MRLASSNKHKLEEYKRFGLGIEIIPSVDLKEIDSFPDKVALYKAKDHPLDDILVEDTALFIEGEDIGVNVRWLLDRVKDCAGKRATWVVMIAYKKDGEISLYLGKTEGVIAYPEDFDESSFGFEDLFIPNGADTTLHRLKNRDSFSARRRAILNAIHNIAYTAPFKVKDIPEWTGKYQEA